MAGTILVVDDVPTNRIVSKVKLASACYDVMLASDAASALQMTKSRRPDLVLMEFNLTDMPGGELLRRLRADPAMAQVPLVAMSGSATQEDRLEALEAGADDLLARTLPDHMLLARLRNLMRGREELSEFDHEGLHLHTVGMAEASEPFARPGHVALVAMVPATGLLLRQRLRGVISDHISQISRIEALAENTLNRCPDAFLIQADRNTIPDALRLLAELRGRSQTRNAAICLQMPDDLLDEATVALDLGASDVVPVSVEIRELGLRLRRMIARKREGDRVRTSLRDGLRMAMVDPLTGLFNRRYALRRLNEIAAEAAEKKQPFAIMVLDLDRFKQVNDQFGHAAGDAVLTEVGRRLAANIRPGDLLARIGGEEFLIALPGADLALAKPVAERLCATIEQDPFILRDAGPVPLTASVGLAIRMYDAGITEDVDATVERADRALLRAKSAGRNQVTISRNAA